MVAIILVILFLLGLIYVRGAFATMMSNMYSLLRNGSSSGLNVNRIFSPSFSVFLITSILFGTVVLASMYPRTGNIFYHAYLDIMPQRNTKGEEIKEGFLLEASYDANIQEHVITKQNLLERLQGHMNRTNLPAGISCGSDHKVSILAIEAYLKRLLLSTTKKLKQEEFEEWAKITHKLFSYVCEERKRISAIMDKIHQDARSVYSMNELRSLLNPLLRLYDTARIQENRFRSRKEVNQITGIPIGELEPRNETALKGLNSFKLKTSVHDTGENTNSPTDYSDPFSYFSAKEDFKQGLLPTQTNELQVLEYLSDQPISRANAQDRGGNS